MSATADDSTATVYFGPGPAALPAPVLEEASRGARAYDGGPLSVLELSHRSAAFEGILDGARDGLRRLLSVPDTHEVLFLQGGASGQFAQVPLNFLPPDGKAGYVVTGTWAKKALAEAKKLGDAGALASSEADGFARLPDLDGVDPSGLAYVHTTSNNTIAGTQAWPLPDFGDVRHVCDMSSDILSRPVDVSRFGLVYAGAQKNAGPAGVTIAVVDREWAASAPETIPTIWRYRTHLDKGSLYHTPPAFAIYVVGLVARWVEDEGGVAEMERRADEKAGLLYGAIDDSGGFYRPAVTVPAHRSKMNVTFRLADEALEPRFLAEAESEGLLGLKGHRSVGGMRASIYNAVPRQGVARLVGFMGAFRATHG